MKCYVIEKQTITCLIVEKSLPKLLIWDRAFNIFYMEYSGLKFKFLRQKNANKKRARIGYMLKTFFMISFVEPTFFSTYFLQISEENSRAFLVDKSSFNAVCRSL